MSDDQEFEIAMRTMQRSYYVLQARVAQMEREHRRAVDLYFAAKGLLDTYKDRQIKVGFPEEWKVLEEDTESFGNLIDVQTEASSRPPRVPPKDLEWHVIKDRSPLMHMRVVHMRVGFVEGPKSSSDDGGGGWLFVKIYQETNRYRCSYEEYRLLLHSRTPFYELDQLERKYGPKELVQS